MRTGRLRTSFIASAYQPLEFMVMAGRLQTILRAQAEGKALGTHPAFMDPGTPVGITDLNIINRSGASGKPAISQREAARHLQAYGGDQAMDWVMDCVRFTADTVANADFHFEPPRVAGAPKKPGVAVTPPSTLATLVDQPNPYMDYIEMMELLVIDMLLVGNAYWFKWQTNSAQQPLAMYRLAPGYVKVSPASWGIGQYEYSVPGMDKLIIPPENIVHFKLANPHSPYYGLGLIQGAGRAADLELALSDSQASYMENHAMPSLAVSSDRRIPRDVFKKMRAQLRARTQGPRNAGELLVLEAGLKLDSIAPSAAQAGYAELSRLSRDRIFAWFRMSPKLLGIMDEAGGSDKITDAQRLFDNKTARPLMNKIQRKITSDLVAAWTLAYAIDYEYQMPQEDLARLGAAYGSLPGVTVDEVRGFARLPAHPDRTIGSMTLNLPGADAGTGQPGGIPTRNGFPDKNLPGEAGRPPNAANTVAFPRAGQPLQTGAAAILAGKKSLDDISGRLEALLRLPEGKSTAPPADTTLPAEKRPDDVLGRKRTTDIDAIVVDLHRDLGDAAKVLERGLLDHVEGKAFKASDIVARLRNSGAWQDFTRMAEAALSRAIQRALSTASVHQATLGLTPSEELDYAVMASELVHAKDTGVRSITKTLKDRISTAAREARSGNAEKPEMQAAVTAALNDWATSQAETIALDQTTRGYNAGTLEVAQSAGSTHVMVSDGEDHDEPCAKANGQTWTIDQARANLVEHPRCRRAFVAIPAVT